MSPIASPSRPCAGHSRPRGTRSSQVSLGTVQPATASESHDLDVPHPTNPPRRPPVVPRERQIGLVAAHPSSHAPGNGPGHLVEVLDQLQVPAHRRAEHVAAPLVERDPPRGRLVTSPAQVRLEAQPTR